MLIEDNWDDWFTYETTYQLYVFSPDGEGQWKSIGTVKIGQLNMAKGQRRAAIPEQFESLVGEFFSLGQGADYYEMAVELALADQLLRSLNDIAFDNQLFRKVRREDVTRVSLLRSVKETTILGPFSRIITGSVPLTAYDFTYTGPQQLSSDHEPIQLDFQVEPGSNPPSNIHVLIGRNGIGKSFI